VSMITVEGAPLLHSYIKRVPIWWFCLSFIIGLVSHAAYDAHKAFHSPLNLTGTTL
jgi:hypothetical protein